MHRYTIIRVILPIIITASLLISCTMSFDSDPTAPAQPVVTIVGDSVTTLMVEVSWQSVSGAGGYHVYRSDGGAYEYIGSTGPEQTTYLDADEDLNLGDLYSYSVAASSLWHLPASASPLSVASAAIQFFLPPSWEMVSMITEGEAVRIRIAALQSGSIAYAYADDEGFIHTGLIYPEDDPDSDEAADVIFTNHINDESGYQPKTSSTDPTFELSTSGNQIYLAFTDATDSDIVRIHKLLPERTEEEGGSVTYSWTHTNPGSSLPPITGPARIDLAVTQGGFGGSPQYLYIAALLTQAATEATILYRMDLSTGSAWGDLSPSKSTDFGTSDVDFTMIGNEPTLAIADPDAGGILKLFTMLDPQAGGVWSSAYPGIPVITPSYGMISLITGTTIDRASPILLTASDITTSPVWDAQRFETDSWEDITGHTGFTGLFT